MASFSLDEFKTEVLSRGLARTNRFEVDINVPSILRNRNNRKISLFVESAALPLLNILTKPYRIYGPAYQRPITSEYGGEGLAMTFHVDREMSIKRFFEDWVEYIINRNNFNVAYRSEYESDIIIRQLDEQNNTTYEIKLEEAFPRNLNLMELNNSAQNQTHRLTVLFAYRKWTRTDLPINDRVVAAKPIIPIQIDPYIPPIRSTNTSRVLNSLGTPDTNVDFSDSTFSTPSA